MPPEEGLQKVQLSTAQRRNPHQVFQHSPKPPLTLPLSTAALFVLFHLEKILNRSTLKTYY